MWTYPWSPLLPHYNIRLYIFLTLYLPNKSNESPIYYRAKNEVVVVDLVMNLYSSRMYRFYLARRILTGIGIYSTILTKIASSLRLIIEMKVYNRR